MHDCVTLPPQYRVNEPTLLGCTAPWIQCRCLPAGGMRRGVVDYTRCGAGDATNLWLLRDYLDLLAGASARAAHAGSPPRHAARV
jgi:hypothetical protein